MTDVTNTSDHAPVDRWIIARASDKAFQQFVGASSTEEAITKAVAASASDLDAFKRAFLEKVRTDLGLPAGVQLPL